MFFNYATATICIFGDGLESKYVADKELRRQQRKNSGAKPGKKKKGDKKKKKKSDERHHETAKDHRMSGAGGADAGVDDHAPGDVYSVSDAER